MTTKAMKKAVAPKRKHVPNLKLDFLALECAIQLSRTTGMKAELREALKNYRNTLEALTTRAYLDAADRALTPHTSVLFNEMALISKKLNDSNELVVQAQWLIDGRQTCEITSEERNRLLDRLLKLKATLNKA